MLAGQSLGISYRVANAGGNTPGDQASWTDALYLSSDNSWNLNDILLGKVNHIGDLGAQDTSYTLAGHSFALLRTVDTATATAGATAGAAALSEFGNWRIPALDTRLTTDQASTNTSGGTAPWAEGAQVWLTAPDLSAMHLVAASAMNTGATGQFDPQSLRFKLATTSETLGTQAGAPTVLHPVFAANQGWTLQAHGDDSASDDSAQASQAPPAPDSLLRLGHKLYSQITGLPWVPTGYTLTDPDGTRYSLDAAGQVTAVRFADGAQWLVTDAGIAGIAANANNPNNPGNTSSSTAQRVDFVRDSEGRITRVTGPADTVGSDAQTFVYRYDTSNRLVLARNVTANDFGTAVAYDAAGLPFADTITANLGAAVNWVSSPASGTSPQNQWSGTLQSGSTTTLAFTVRQSELASGIQAAGAVSAVIIAIESQFADAAATLQVTGATVLGSTRVNGVQTTLLRVTEAGVKLVRLQGTGTSEIRVSVAGDMNRDGVVDGIDSAAWVQAAAGNVTHAANALVGDLNGDGVVNTTDRQVLYANYGFKTNQAPLAAAVLPVGKTHTDLTTSLALEAVAQDQDGDQILWRIVGATHGSARLSGDGTSLLFTPDAGYSGPATVTVQADDGFATSAPIELTVNVSDAKLVAIRVTRLSTMGLGSARGLEIIGDFADQTDVVLTRDYVTIQSDNVNAVAVEANGMLRAKQEGFARITVSARGHSAQNVVAVGSTISPPDIDRYTNELNVYPISIDLAEGVGQRQIDVHTLDGSTLGADVSASTTGTRYFISDPTIADISADGLITAKSSGSATITVVRGRLQGTMQVKVRAANTGPSIATVSHGVVAQDSDGNTLTIGADALNKNTVASINKLDISTLATPLPAANILSALGAVRVDLGGAQTGLPLQLAVKVAGPIDAQTGQPTVLAAGTQVFFWQEGTINDAQGVSHNTWWLMDDGVIGNDGLARTASQPYPGITVGGNILVTGTGQRDNQTGAAKMSRSVLNYDAIWSSLAFAAIMPTSIMALGAIGAFSDMGGVLTAIKYTIEGSYQQQIPQGALLPNSTVSIPAPPTLPATKPAITGVQYNPTTRLLTLSGVNFLSAGEVRPLTKLKVWLVPIGDQLPKITAAGTAPVNGLIWQPFEVTPQPDGTLQITLPAGVALSQHDIYIERASLPLGPIPLDPDGPGSASGKSAVLFAPKRGANLNAEVLSLGEAQAALNAAKQIWINTGVAASVFQDVTVSIEHLASNALALTTAKTIALSSNAAQWGWYINTDPSTDFNYIDTVFGDAVSNAVTDSPADNKVDLLTALLNQLGTIALVHGDGGTDDLMNEELAAGVRRVIGPADIPGRLPPKRSNPLLREGVLIDAALLDMLKNTRAVDAPIYSALVAAAPIAPSQDTLVTTATGIDIFQPATVWTPGANPQPVLIKKVTQDNLGNSLELTGGYAQQIVFNDDGTLAFIAGTGGKIYVLDTMTQDIVITYNVLGSTTPISGLTINDGWLYVAEGSNYGQGGRLLRINVDSGPDFFKKQQNLNLPAGLTAPVGFRDMAVNKGRYLAVTAPTGRIPTGNFPAPAPGNVYVIDLFAVTDKSNLDVSAVATLNLSAYPGSNLGKGPLYITSGDQRGQFLVSNSKDISRGVAGITFATDAKTGKLLGSSSLVDPVLKPESVPNWLQAKMQQNIQRAADTVVFNYQGKTYALVADYNFLFNDVHFVDYENYGQGKQIGGKIGIIQDPFGEKGAPIFMGATTPIPGVALKELRIDQAGMLYASAFVEDTSGQYSGGAYSDMFYNSLFVWNAGQLVQSALDAQKAGRNLTIPIDRTGVPGAQLPAVTPARYDTAGDGQLFGTIYGVGSYSSKQAAPSISLQNVPYLQELAPSLYEAASAAALKAGESVPAIQPDLDRTNGTLNTFMIRTMASLVSFGSAVAASALAIFGKDNAEMLAQAADAQRVLQAIGYDFETGSTVDQHLAGIANAVEGLISGIAMMEANIAGVMFRDVALLKALAGFGFTKNLPSDTEFLQMLDDNPTVLGTAKYLGMAFLKYHPITTTAQAVYSMSAAAVAGNDAEVRKLGYELFAELGSMKWGETPASKREFQRKVKELGFLEQQLKRGVIEETPMRDILVKSEGLQQYVIEPAKKNAAGEVVAEQRIVTTEAFAREVDGSMYMSPSGEASLRSVTDVGGCFVGGTLVHTDKGLVPIENLRVGDMVLSQPEMKGELAYKPVVNTFVHEDKEVWLLVYFKSQEMTPRHLVVTGNHPIWIKDAGWTSVDRLELGSDMELHDGTFGCVFQRTRLLNTETPDVGWTYDGDAYEGPHVDLRGDSIQVTSRIEDYTPNIFALSNDSNYFRRRVYNIEVEDFHSYYVGESGVWVHNTNCGEAVGTAVVRDVRLNSQSEIDAGLGIHPEAPVFKSPADASAFAKQLLVEEGVVLVEKTPTGTFADYLREKTQPGTMTGSKLVQPSGFPEPVRTSVEWGLIFPNSKGAPSLDVMTFESRIAVQTPDGLRYTNTFNDIKASWGPMYKLNTDGTLAAFTQIARNNAIDTFRKASEATANKGATAMYTVENIPVDGVLNRASPLEQTFMLFEREILPNPQTAGYAKNIMFRDPAFPEVVYSYNRSNLKPGAVELRSTTMPDGSTVTLWKGEGNYSTAPLPGEMTGIKTYVKEAYEAELANACFAMDTKVHTPYGFTQIEYLSVGSMVLSRCERTGEQGYRRVTRVFEHENRPTLDVKFQNEKGEFGYLETTAEHPFWVNGVGWVQASQLQQGQQLETVDDDLRPDIDRPEGQKLKDFHTDGIRRTATVVGVKPHDRSTTVYNIEVEEFHTYFVGFDGVWVHNKTNPPVSRVLAESPGTLENRYARSEIASGDVANDAAARGENRAALILSQHGFEVVQLPDGSLSTALGKTEGRVPDDLVNGRTADVFTPQTSEVNPNGSVRNICSTIAKKSAEQSSDIIVYLYDVPITATQILANINEFPIPALGRLYLIEPGKVTVHDYAATDLNKPIYGQLVFSPGGVSVVRLTAPPGSGIVRHQEVFAQGPSLNITPLTLVDVDALLPAARQYWLNQGARASVLNSVQIGIGQLPVALAGINQGYSITLSQDGAGWGWFVDTTPNASEEFTGDIASQTLHATSGLGSAANLAAGKLDLLTVLIHELGHVLGAQDLTRAEDVMSGHLEAGVRRLPTAQDTAQWLAAQNARADGVNNIAGFAVRVGSLTVSGTPPTVVNIVPASINPTLQGGNLSTLQDWATQGAVVASSVSGGTPTGATLSENGSLQTRLNQVFMVGPQDRFLSFTLSNLALDDARNGAENGPNDAFEAALLNANTGAALLSPLGLSHTDALLNLQAGNNASNNGLAELAAQGVTHVTHADGSRTYVVDLSGITRDADGKVAVNLSFDLIGFGTTAASMGSHVQVSNVRLLGAVQTVDDSATGAEDSVLTIAALANDLGLGLGSGQTYLPVVVAAPAHGTVQVNADGSFSYTPEANFWGTDSFSYQLGDGTGASSTASNISTVSLTITPVNDAPTLGNQALTTLEDTAVTGNLLATAADVDSPVLTPSIVAGPLHGALTVNPDGSFSYQAHANYFGLDSFTYRVSDGALDADLSNLATVTLTVTAVNDVPVATDTTITTDEDTPLSIDLRNLGLDVEDANGALLSPVIVTGPANGSLSLNPDGSYTYLPAADFNGADSIRFALRDSEGALSNEATLSITITAVNDAPTLGSQTLTTAEDAAVTGNLLAGAADVDSATLAAAIVAGPQHGALTVNADGSFSYLADVNYFGADSFTYKVNDGSLDSSLATVSLTITPVNDAPVAADVTVSTAEDTPVAINLIAADAESTGANLQFVIQTQPQHGVLTFNASGSYSYLANQDFNGTDSFTYKVNDGELDSNLATVSITVKAVNDAPTLGNQSLTTAEDTAISGNLLATAADVDSTTLTPSIMAGPLHGSLSVNADGSFSYLAEANYFGADSFTYRVNDGELDSGLATVSLTVTAVNDVPVATDASATTEEDTPFSIDLRNFGLDIEDAALTPVIVTGPANGALSQNPDGSYTYVPTANFNGNDSIRFALRDSQGALSNEATLSIAITAITAVNDAPTLGNQALTTAEDTAVAGNLLATAADVDSATLAAAIFAGPQHGALTVNLDGTFSYLANANYFGTDSFTYKVNDGDLDSGFATVSLTITPVNDTPVAADVTASTAEDTPIAINMIAADVDSTGASLQFVIQTQPQHGSLTLSVDGGYSYLDSDTLTYSLSHSVAGSSINSQTGVLTRSPTAAGKCSFGLEWQHAANNEHRRDCNG